MTDEACWRELQRTIGALSATMEGLRGDLQRIDLAYEKRMDALSNKMSDCLQVCEIGHTRISTVESSSKDHEDRIRALEKLTGVTEVQKNWGLAFVATVWSAGSYVVFEIIKSHWDALKDAIR